MRTLSFLIIFLLFPSTEVSGLSHDFPRVGLIRWETSAAVHTCVGTLIFPGLVLTAGHCAPASGEPLTFALLSAPAKPIPVQHIWKGPWKKEADSRRGDWALLKIDADRKTPQVPISDASVLPRRKIESFRLTQNLQGAWELHVLPCESKTSDSQGVFTHDCALLSGTPLFEKTATGWMLVGLHTAKRSGKDHRGTQIATDAVAFAKTAAQLEKTLRNDREVAGVARP